MKRITGRQWILAIFCGGVLFGTLLANLVPKLYLPTAAELLGELATLLEGPTSAYSGYFRYLLGIRLIPILVIWICLLTPYGGEGLCVAALWYGICCGAVISGAVLLYGIAGVLLFLTAVFPQYVFYVLIYMQLIAKHELRKNRRHGQPWSFSEEVGFLLVITVLFLAGVLLETYLNPLMLRLGFLMV